MIKAIVLLIIFKCVSIDRALKCVKNLYAKGVLLSITWDLSPKPSKIFLRVNNHSNKTLIDA